MRRFSRRGGAWRIPHARARQGSRDDKFKV